jgi:hypothetical protein
MKVKNQPLSSIDFIPDTSLPSQHMQVQSLASGKILVAQGGGPTAVINQSLVGVVLEARRFGNIERVYGARHGVRGIVNEDFVDLTQETSHNLELVASTPASALGSTRDKPDLAYCQEIFKVLQAHEIEHFFYIGGNDSSDTVRIVSLEARQSRLPAALHPHPQDHRQRPGRQRPHAGLSQSAARFVAQAFAGANLDNAALPGVYVGVVMGRHAGFPDRRLRAGQEVPRRRPAPDLPARAHLRAGHLPGRREGTYERYGRCVIAVSKASTTPAARRWPPAGQGPGTRRARQRAALRQRRAGRPAVRGDQGQAQDQARARRHLRLPAAQLHRLRLGRGPARGARGGRKGRAVRDVGQQDGSVAIKRTGFYSVDYELLPLEAVAGKTRVMEDAFIAASGTDVTDAFRMYLRPLLGSGMPDAFRLRPNPVAKVLQC